MVGQDTAWSDTGCNVPNKDSTREISLETSRVRNTGGAARRSQAQKGEENDFGSAPLRTYRTASPKYENAVEINCYAICERQCYTVQLRVRSHSRVDVEATTDGII